MSDLNFIRREIILRELAKREMARRYYQNYLQFVHGAAWIPTRFSNYLAREIQNFLESKTNHAFDILILETPPQHGKSWTVTESLPAWYLGKNPDKRVILISYNEESAERFSRRNREKTNLFGDILFHIKLGALNRATEFEIAEHRGRLISRGVMSGVTGHPADLMIIDDPIKNREEADSPIYRNKLWAEWQNTLKSRLSANAKIILILTPWHEDDLAARILKLENQDAIKLIRLPVEAENPKITGVLDPLGREPGEPLCPELGKNLNWLKQFKAAYINDPQGGARAWRALYLCSPRAETGNIIKRDWWKYYQTPPICPVQIISVDAAFKSSETNDFVAITVWGKSGENYYLLDCLNQHFNFIQTLDAIRDTREKYPDARAVLIEDKANGPAIIDVLSREIFCIPVNPDGGKESRLYAASPAIESGHVFLPQSAPWLENYLDQFTSFPAAAHDDMVDSSTQALRYLFPVRADPDLQNYSNQNQNTNYQNHDFFTGEDIYNIY